MKFAIETSESGQVAYIVDAHRHVCIQLTKPADDFQHAWRVAEYLSDNIHAVSVDGVGGTEPVQRDAHADR